MFETGRCWDVLAQRDDRELVNLTRNLTPGEQKAHRLLLDVLLQYGRTIDSRTVKDDSSG